jgi:hypothetical protein
MPDVPYSPSSLLNRPVIWPAETARIVAKMPEKGIFLTGIEGSDPRIDGVRRDQLKEAHNFYVNYEQRLERIRAIGITWLRFGMPYSQVHLGKNLYDFSFFDKVYSKCEALGITIMADLLHFGLPDWMHQEEQDYPYFQNPYFPVEFANYARAFARRYSKIQYYTIVNEPFVTAYFSAKIGFWNEQRASSWENDSDYIRAAANIARATILGRAAIESVWQEENRPDEPIYVQNDSFELAVAAPGSGREAEVDRFNLRRFAILDLTFAHRDETMRSYLLDQGMTPQQYEWFIEHGSNTRTILGIDYYPTCVHTFEANSVINHSAHMDYQLYDITKQYWERYRMPLLHTEVNAWPEHALAICQKTYDSLYQLSQEGYPVLGMGWYGDDLQVGWHVAMRGPNSFEETPVGLFYRGQPQPVTNLFKELMQKGFPLLAQQKEIMSALAASQNTPDVSAVQSESARIG